MSVKTLGEAIEVVHGKPLFTKVEELRRNMKKVRGGEASFVEDELHSVYKAYQKYKTPELRKIAKSFSLMLELINTCESAYRSHRLASSKLEFKKAPRAVIYVFTSHPTESRSRDFLRLMGRVEDLLLEGLETDLDSIRERLFYYLRLALRLDLANNEKPQVTDEMDQIFHFVLSPKILQEQSLLKGRGVSVHFRTWVGGDKDGHPGVNEVTMKKSWSKSRAQFLRTIDERLHAFEEELALIAEGKDLRQKIAALRKEFLGLGEVKAGDGKRLEKVKKSFGKLNREADKNLLSSPELLEIERILGLYPALVLPLEIREDSELILKALTDKSQPIYRMLLSLKEVASGTDPKWYVRGFVISMCQTTEDLLAAVTITRRALGELMIPAIPLFENEKGLLGARDILSGAFKKTPLIKEHRSRWDGIFEVMVGYSDSSKENGVLPARLLIEEALFDLEKFLQKNKLTPVFFHGSGGSTSRGGGTVLEQVAWLPKSALDIFKVTIQGEMVQRNFGNPRIMRSQVGKVIEGFEKSSPKRPDHPKSVRHLSESIQRSYRALVSDPAFHELTSKATPYDFLDLLKMGSRPTKRSIPGKFSLRAIPWILCWTQTRLLLPVWWGTGSAWKELSKSERKKFIAEYETSPLLQTYVKNLGFTLAKVELGVWNFHLDQSGLPKRELEFWKKAISTELELSEKFFREVSGQKDFTWFRPWLGESIHFRSSMIHPLNVIQKLALERKDEVLLRETVTGIACGMLTTG